MTSTSPPPRRRFLPQPVETSARSTKRQHIDPSESITNLSETAGAKDDNMVAVPKPRKFLPQPIEETTRSSRKKDVEKEKSAQSKDASATDESNSQNTNHDDSHPTPKPTTSTRRFAPEPVETTARTSRRKFAVEPVETTSRTSKDKKEKEKDTSPSSRPRRKFAPQPVETTTVRRRRKDQDEDSNESPPDSPSETSSRVSSRQSSGSRRFSPELIETAKGSYRHKKESESESTKSKHARASSPPLSRTTTKSPEPAEPSEPTESRFCAAALAKRHHEEHRRHSYCIPNLPMIESESSSDESSEPSITELSSTTDNEPHKLAKIEESSGESYTDYVLSLNDQEDKKTLQEQAMAAYVNEVPYEPVAHFAADEEDEEDLNHGTLSTSNGANPLTFRRSSQAEHDWEMQNMRKHHEQLERAKKELFEDTAGVSRFSAAALAARHHLGQVHKQPVKTQKQKDEDAEYARMKKAASPPMLGDDLVFPFTISPKMTRCDVDQAPRPRRADSDDDHMSTGTSSPQLWNAKTNSQNSQGAGLWMGMCQKAPEPSRPPTPTRSGIQTPAYEMANPFDSHTPRGNRTPARRMARPYSGQYLMPVTPSRGGEDEFVSSIDKKLQLEKQIEEEFTPRVITQIYNYLSLGFPSLARDFDGELSKISRISIKELRKDDQVAKGTIKGHVGAPEAEGTWEEDEDGTVRGCRRWDALRLYVREWARQSPNFTSDKGMPVAQDPALAQLKSLKGDAWGATVRRGSWAQ